MMRSLFALTMAFVATSASHAGEPLAIHVAGTVAKAATKADQDELQHKSAAARTAYFDLQEALKKQFGKDPEKWPADKRAECEQAHDAFFEAQTNWFYSIGLKQKDIDDSVRELAEALAEAKVVRVAGSSREADLVVEVLGRAKVTDEGWGGRGTIAAQLALRVGPGGRMSAPTLAGSGVGWSAKKEFWKKSSIQSVHTFTTEAPYWLLISTKPGMGWSASYKGAAGQVAEAIGKFGAENADKLEAARKAAN